MHPFFADYLERLEALNRDFVAAIDGLSIEALDWVPGEDMNSLCVLVVHTTSAARFWIGDAALGEASGRDRAEEFTVSGMSDLELQAHFEKLEEYVRDALTRISMDDLATMRAVEGRNREFSVSWSLLHALEHTALHLGHAQITRQLWDQRNASG